MESAKKVPEDKDKIKNVISGCVLYHYDLNNFWTIRHERNHDIFFCSKMRWILSQWDIDDDTYVELSFHQKLMQYKSVYFIIRQIIQKIWIDRKNINLYPPAYPLLMRLLSTIQCLGTLFAISHKMKLRKQSLNIMQYAKWRR